MVWLLELWRFYACPPEPVLTAAQQSLWVAPAELTRFAFPAGHRKLIDSLSRDLRLVFRGSAGQEGKNMALVVFVFTATLMLAEGLHQTLVATGSPGNAIVLRKGSETEVQSGVTRDAASAVTTRPEIAVTADGRPLAARESVVLLALTKKSTGKVSNVVVRGVEQASLALRPIVRIMVR